MSIFKVHLVFFVFHRIFGETPSFFTFDFFSPREYIFYIFK